MKQTYQTCLTEWKIMVLTDFEDLTYQYYFFPFYLQHVISIPWMVKADKVMDLIGFGKMICIKIIVFITIAIDIF